jgi:hypothetical protein
MPKAGTLSKKPVKQVATRLYHHVFCEQMKELTIKLTKKGQRLKADYAIIALSSKETIRTGLKAVDASPFKTVFVVDETSGQVLFALSQNEEYVQQSKKKNPPPPPPPPPPPTSACCQRCFREGGYACDPYPDGSCICYGRDRGGATGGGLDDPLDTIAP